MKYKTEIPMPDGVKEVIEKCRQVGLPQLTEDGRLFVIFEVGGEGEISDAYDLAVTVVSLEQELGALGYYGGIVQLDRPVELGEA
jgi:hypothetical protein